jgi:NADH:ubiquinone oxidoreductase subunit 5 (subunit L)/multisubunit Na+/H+ antiporter MnhA subunit
MYSNYTIQILNFHLNVIELASIFLLSCAFIKSAQFGPHIWLPDSMEAPVPASSLIHSATLVSAGIFVILRLYPIFELSHYSFFILPIMGSLTAAYGGVVGAYQADIKRILAYSTISHCGFLMLLCSFFANEYVVLYLYVHGFFKASVFMCVGNVIRISKNYQDFRRMGAFYKYLPFECYASFVCLSNLAGLPFSLGFYIKHLIFLGYQSYFYFYFFIFFNTFVAAISGLFYSYRIFYYVFFDFKKGRKQVYSTLNRQNLFSSYYTNTSRLSNFSICSLIITSYLISFYFFYILLGNSIQCSDFLNFSNSTNMYTYFNHSYTGVLYNYSYLN